MARSLVDTDILSEVLKAKNRRVLLRAEQYRATHGVLTTSTITVVEIVKGFHIKRQAGRIADFLSALQDEEVLPLDIRSAELAGRIYADLERTGQMIGRATQ